MQQIEQFQQMGKHFPKKLSTNFCCFIIITTHLFCKRGGGENKQAVHVLELKPNFTFKIDFTANMKTPLVAKSSLLVLILSLAIFNFMVCNATMNSGLFKKVPIMNSKGSFAKTISCPEKLNK